jgi:hypothetical protein
VKSCLAAVLVCSLVVDLGALAAVRGKEVMYVGGTIANLPEGTIGALDTTHEKALVFDSPKGKFSIPYENVTSLEYGQKAGRRLGVALTITMGVAFQEKETFPYDRVHGRE